MNYTNREVLEFLEGHLEKLEFLSTKTDIYNYLHGLGIENQVLMITLMYLGRDYDEDPENSAFWGNNEEIVNDFKSVYDKYYRHWGDDVHVVDQMVSKVPFLDYLRSGRRILKKLYNL